MTDYALPMYDIYREWIRRARRDGRSWEEIIYAGKGTEEGLAAFLAIQKEINWWTIDANDWKALVAQQERAENETRQQERAQQGGMIVAPGQDNALCVPSDPFSSWMLYKNHLLENGFAQDAVGRIEDKTLRILRRMKRDNPVAGDAVKGLVVGNVQSGKTANMAALMAMAADWGWNMFIILSGTIESLRQQTQSRMLSDLNIPGNIAWTGLEHLSGKTSNLAYRTQYLSFEEGSKHRYFTVCLKNSTRLKNLIDWLQSDPKKAKQMRILIIDDEADQAGVNTAKIDKAERKKINKLIVNMVQGLTSAGKPAKEPYLCMNYIGYTATPYANILNESGLESLYPSSFIATLDVSNQYFGPQQIFGQEENEGDGLDIVRVLPDEDLDLIRELHEGSLGEMPGSFQDSMAWFLCCAACFRVWGLRKPISMLVHTSQITDHHQYVAEMVLDWFSEHDVDEIIEICREVWERETVRFDKQALYEQYPDYGRLPEEVCDYPSFDELVPHLSVLAQEPQHIKMDDDQDLTYHDGVHLCVDNSRNTKITDESEHIRLAYPDNDHMPELAPAFIVIGGATLSRGLTIEGLVSTFFVRSVSQADSLMQMGRWFGYRKKYELLPRIWMTSKTRRQFVFLSTLDYDLRGEIRDMEAQGKTPRQYAVKVNNSPKVSFIRLTARNKMQSAVNAEFDYSGVMSQTTLFDDSISIQNQNIELTQTFIASLPKPVVGIGIESTFKNPHTDNGYLWTNIPFATVRDQFLKKFKFQQRSRAFSDMDSLAAWITTMTDEGKLGPWNVKLAGLKGTSKRFDTAYGSVGKVNRSQKTATQIDGLLDIGVLRDPKDMVADIDAHGNPDLYTRLENFKSSEIREIRREAGMITTPLMVIYCIDKDSEARVRTGDSYPQRKNLEAQTDLIGISICIPGGKPDGSYVTKVQVKLADENLDGTSETEELE